MAPMAMGMAMVKPNPLKAPRDAQTEGGGVFCFILFIPSLFSLTFYLSDYSTWNEIIATMALLGLEVLLSALAFRYEIGCRWLIELYCFYYIFLSICILMT